MVRVARLPEMRLAYFEREAPEEPIDAYWRSFGALWEEFNAWRLKVRPALGRIDIAAVAMALPKSEGTVFIRTAVPIRSDYRPPAPAKTTFFPGGTFAYCYADNIDELAAAFAAVTAAIRVEAYELASGPLEMYKFHYNMDQHPADCGFLVTREDGAEPAAEPGPLPIAR